MHNRRAFTLIELLMVIAVITILAGLGIGGMGMATRRASEADTRSRMERLKNALQEHHRDWGYYPEQDPADEFNIENFPHKSGSIEGFHDRDGNPYLGDDEVDGQGRYLDGFRQPFRYQSPGTVNQQSYDLWSIGVNGQNDSTDREDNPQQVGDDITNWTR